MLPLEREQLIKRLTLEWNLMKKTFTRENLADHFWLSGIDVRLQVPEVNGELSWINSVLYLGDSQNDTDHQGYWSSGFLDYDWEESELKANISSLADELIEEVEENYFSLTSN